MKFLGLILLALSINVSAMACEDHKGEVSSFGNGVKGNVTHKISDVMAGKEGLAGTYVRVSGKVTDVCPMKGCWMTLKDTKTGDEIRVKVKDDVVVFPKEAKGKIAIAEGTLKARHYSKRQAIKYYEHLAEERGEKFDKSTVKGPVTLYEIQAKGAEIEGLETANL
jgi:hypothetical protein